jgi:hypothetical protein
MRPLRVVVVDIDAQYAFEVAAIDDQQPVEAFRADGSDEALGDRVCSRRPMKCPQSSEGPPQGVNALQW